MGFLASEGHGSLPVIVAAVTLGMFSGSVLFYHIAKYYGVSVLKKPFFARLLNEETLGRTRAWFEKYGVVSLFAAKFIPGVYFCAVISSGILSVRRYRIYPAFLFSNLAAFATLAFIGKFSGENWRQVYGVIGRAGAAVSAIVLLAGSLAYLIFRYFRNKKIS
jgi:membrane protein DedA with SNARE-associated domain